MRVVVFSDVHGNLPALELMLAHTSDADAWVCLGDAVGYGPWTNECVDLIAQLPGLVWVEGNHERDFLAGVYSGTNSLARTFFAVSYESFARHGAIRGLPAEDTLSSFTLSHTIDDRYIFPDTPIVLDRDRIIGHTHRQFSITQPPYVLWNAGSVGQNRQYIDVINYLVVEVDRAGAASVFRQAFQYDPQPVIAEMRTRGYPQACIDYYATKPWHG